MLQILNLQPIVYDAVPENWKSPFNRWYQIPAGFPFEGGYMQVINPMANREPWKALTGGGGPTQEENVLGAKPKPGFIETHGPLPPRDPERRIWKDAHPHFVAAGLPDAQKGDPEIAAGIEAANAAAADYDLTDGRIYQGRYGTMVRFPASHLFDFEIPLHTWIMATALAITQYQIHCARYKGIKPTRWHDFVPDSVRALVK